MYRLSTYICTLHTKKLNILVRGACDLSSRRLRAADRGYANFLELRYGELLRIHLPRSRVNKGDEEGRSPLGPQPRFRGLAIPASDALATRPTRPGHSP